MRSALLEQIRGRPLVEKGERKIVEVPLFPGLSSNSLMMHFTQFFNNDLCSDFKLILKRNNSKEIGEVDAYGNKKWNVIYAHKFVLSQSEWFRAIFDSNMMEQLTNELIVNESEENLDAFTAMISMMYGNYVPSFEKLNSTLVGEMLICFDKYQATQLFDKVTHAFVLNLVNDTPQYSVVNILWLYSMFGDRIKSTQVNASISSNFLSLFWVKTVTTSFNSKSIESVAVQNKRQEFNEFFNKQDFDSCYFFLEEFVKSHHSFDLVCKYIDEWIAYDESNRFDKGYLLYRIALKSKDRNKQ